MQNEDATAGRSFAHLRAEALTRLAPVEAMVPLMAVAQPARRSVRLSLVPDLVDHDAATIPELAPVQPVRRAAGAS